VVGKPDRHAINRDVRSDTGRRLRILECIGSPFLAERNTGGFIPPDEPVALILNDGRIRCDAWNIGRRAKNGKLGMRPGKLEETLAKDSGTELDQFVEIGSIRLRVP
jgi:hypothetical protein